MNLNDWLGYIESIHPSKIDLTLERIKTVVERLNLHISFPIISVGGTNGKGSTCAILESIYKEGGYNDLPLLQRTVSTDRVIALNALCEDIIKREVGWRCRLAYIEYEHLLMGLENKGVKIKKPNSRTKINLLIEEDNEDENFISINDIKDKEIKINYNNKIPLSNIIDL